jgi:hypothetical protein
MNYIPIADAIDDIDCGESAQKFTVSTYQSWIEKHSEYAKHFTRSKSNPAPLKQDTVYADFDNIIDANELYRALNSLGVPAFKNFMT